MYACVVSCKKLGPFLLQACFEGVHDKLNKRRCRVGVASRWPFFLFLSHSPFLRAGLFVCRRSEVHTTRYQSLLV